MFAWNHGRDDELRRLVFEAGRRLREYRVPLYVIESDDEDAVRAIFHRVNTAGKPLRWTTVHDALYGHKSGPPPTLPALASQLEELGMGTLDEETQLLPCLVAMRGQDVTRPLGEHLQRDSTVLDGAVADVMPVLRRVLGFLRVDAEIPHLRLLPSSAPLVVLARLFTLHPEPNERVTTLLVRWVWRLFLSRDVDERTLKRRGIASIDGDLESSVQRLLGLVGDGPTVANFLAPDVFDARAAQSRLALLGMASRKPRRLGLPVMTDTSEIDVAELIQQADLAAFRPLFPLSGDFTSIPANRLLLPGSGAAFSERYRAMTRRPVVGQWFEDQRHGLQRGDRPGDLPAFFANMIPEGSLRFRIGSRLGVADDDDFGFLCSVGADLEPAVTDAYRAALRRHWQKVPLLQPYASSL